MLEDFINRKENICIEDYVIHFTDTFMLLDFCKNPVDIFRYEVKEYRHYLKKYFLNYKKNKFSFCFPPEERFVVRVEVFCFLR